MFRLLITLLTAAIVVLAQHGPASLKVTGGTDADISDFPYLVLMATDNVGYYCSGTLISTTFALTSGYCAYVASFFTDPTYVVSNASSFNDVDVVKTYLLNIIVHPDYDLITKTNDIGVIGVDHPLNCVNCLPISLSSSGVSIGDSVIISGWGYVRESGSKLVKPDVLQTAEVIVVDPDECEGNYSLLIKDNMFCAYSSDGGGYRSGCGLDEGAGAVFQGKLVGLYSYGICGGQGHPGIYTNITSFLPWIQVTLGIIPVDESI